jgi:hypothetical protein
MASVEEENTQLREKMTTMQAEIENLTTMVTSLLANQNQGSTSVPRASGVPVPPPAVSAPITAPRLSMPEGCTWGLSEGFLRE